MKTMANANDLALLSSVFPYTTPRQIPLRFTYDGRQVVGIPEEFSVCVNRRAMGADIILYDIIATDPMSEKVSSIV